jgi:hypothetical protein
MNKTAIALGLLAAALTSPVFAAEGPVPHGISHLDHVFVIMMENHGYSQILDNPNAPFLNQYAQSANLATNYFAIAHPSLTNYLEVVGGSNFGVLSDNNPDWHNASCSTNLATGVAATDNPPTGNICPIAGSGTDAETPAIDYTNETQGPPGEINIDGVTSIAAESNIVGKTIADQLVARHRSWKAYEESLPPEGADGINYDIVALYAAKHAPFVYFRNVQRGDDRDNSLNNIVDFEGSDGLFADLREQHVPTFSFIAPNQCNDQHGRGNAGAFCNFDPSDDGSQEGLNPALIYRGDVTAKRIVDAIHDSSVWRHGRNAIVLLWDENDYSLAPNINQVMTIVETNYGRDAVQSNQFYTHYSLLKTLEGGFNLPCLNHACDANVATMSDLFADSHH